MLKKDPADLLGAVECFELLQEGLVDGEEYYVVGEEEEEEEGGWGV